DKIRKLEAGTSTLHDALSGLGPPTLIVRYGDLDRLYYVSWDNLNFKFSVSAPLPLGRSISTDAFILGLGAEELRLVLLEFDRRGVLRHLRVGAFGQSSDGQ